jgi:hypothetical protein
LAESPLTLVPSGPSGSGAGLAALLTDFFSNSFMA